MITFEQQSSNVKGVGGRSNSQIIQYLIPNNSIDVFIPVYLEIFELKVSGGKTILE
jgi:hypothetical protein